MLWNFHTWNEQPWNGYSLIEEWLHAAADASFVIGVSTDHAADASFVSGISGFSAADASFVIRVSEELVFHIISADAAQVGNVPADRSKVWPDAATPLTLESEGYITHITITKDGTVYEEGVDYIVEEL